MTDPSIDLIEALVDNLRGAEDGWESLAIVLSFSGPRLSGTYGYAYGADGEPIAVASRPSAVAPAAAAYLADRYPVGEPSPVKLLVQVDRASGRYLMTFEDTDRDRWKVTPATLDAVPEELRPGSLA